MTAHAHSIGNYSISIAYNLPWNKKITPVSDSVKKRKKTLRPIINPIFEKCASLTEDKFWQNIFMDCSRGKFPRGFTFKNNLITYKKGSKNFKVEISNSSVEAYTVTIKFFQDIAGIMSKADREKLEKAEEEKYLSVVNNDLTWKEVKTEKLKDILINEFIADVSAKMQFNEEESKEFTTTVKKGFILKCFGANNVKMENGKIVEISGLIFDENSKQYVIDEDYISYKEDKRSKNLGIEREENKPKINFMELWSKYLENLINKRSKKIHSYSSSLLQVTSLNSSQESLRQSLSQSYDLSQSKNLDESDDCSKLSKSSKISYDS